jgi:hypothetical protein
MSANNLTLSMHDSIIYSLLVLYGLLMVLILTYVHGKLRTAAKALKLLEAECQKAESRHAGLVGAAQEQLSRLAAAQPARTLPIYRTSVNFDLRNQILAMAKRGIAGPEIARSCRLDESEVEVVLGMVRIQR